MVSFFLVLQNTRLWTLHTNEYYLNVETLLTATIGEGLGRTDIIELLRDIGDELQSGDFPIHEELSNMIPG